MKSDKKELLKVENITKSFKDKRKKEIEVLKNLNFSLYEGECLGIVGESGSGKSTLARIIAGIDDETSGKIFYKNKLLKEILKNKNMRKNIQMIFQEPISSFSPRMTIENYLYEPLKNYEKMSKKDAFYKIEEIVKKVGLNPKDVKKYPHQFSGGQLQRIAIARAIITKSEIVICDEITSALDVHTQDQILNLLEKLKNELKISYVFVSHDLHAIQKISDRIIVLYKGEILEILQSKNFIEDVKSEYTKKLVDSILKL